MPMIARMFRRVPLAISWPAWTGISGHRNGASRMTPADSHDRETSPLKRPDHLHPRNGREGLGHQARSRVSVSSSGGPTSASNASSASRRPATAACARASDRRLPPRRPDAAVRRRTRRRPRPARRRRAHGLRGSQSRFPTPGPRRGTARWVILDQSRMIVGSQPRAGPLQAACATGPVRRAEPAAALSPRNGDGRDRSRVHQAVPGLMRSL